MAGLGRFCLSDVYVLLVSGAMCWGVRFSRSRFFVFPKKGDFGLWLCFTVILE